jgi:hypothetical protein
MPKRKIIIPIGPSIAYVTLTQEKFSLIDREDAPYVQLHNWNAHKDTRSDGYYAAAAILDENGRYRYKGLHAYILGTSGHQLMPDHRNGNRLDNRRANLRKATHSQNQCNYSLRRSNTSGFRGVWPRKGKWQSAIKFGGVKRHLGTFLTRESAAEAYRIAALEIHGEFVHQSQLH